MAINSVTAAAEQSSALTSNSTSTTSSTSSTANQRDMFMTLLVAQLKNQDPLQPQDGAAFVSQLAQLNSLDQLSGIKQSIESLVTLLSHRTRVTTLTDS